MNEKPHSTSTSYRQISSKETRESNASVGFKAPFHWLKKCIVCQKPEYWSTNNPKEKLAMVSNSIRK